MRLEEKSEQAQRLALQDLVEESLFYNVKDIMRSRHSLSIYTIAQVLGVLQE